MGFEPLANFWGFGLGLQWTEKTGLYTYIENVFYRKRYYAEINIAVISYMVDVAVVRATFVSF